jgi:hypothetical protein
MPVTIETKAGAAPSRREECQCREEFMPDGDQRPPASLAVNLLHSDETPPAAAEKLQIPAHDSTPRNLAFLLTGGFFGLLFLLCFKEPPSASLAVLNVVLGSLGTAWVGAMAYFFGATQGGRAKDWMLFQSQPNPQSK